MVDLGVDGRAVQLHPNFCCGFVYVICPVIKKEISTTIFFL
jgi:hypothetical protein